MTGILIINKPQNWTSHDVVAKMRRLLGEKRIGHGGTLDPMATGVLPLFVGRATRAVEFAENVEKEYIAGLRLGLVTDTQDTTGSVLETYDVNVSEETLIRVLKGFKGERLQVPPMYSAVKIGGKKLYEYAREGKSIKRPARKILIKELELLSFDGTEVSLRIVCSKGTYVRTICHDIGRLLGCGGGMSGLIRMRSGVFDINRALTIEEVEQAAKNGEAASLLLPVDTLFLEFGSLKLDKKEEKRCRNGARINKAGVVQGRYRVYSEDGEFLMLGEVRPDGQLVTIKNFFEIK
jgi:tRNA pseudouridine55 synthase